MGFAPGGPARGFGVTQKDNLNRKRARDGNQLKERGREDKKQQLTEPFRRSGVQERCRSCVSEPSKLCFIPEALASANTHEQGRPDDEGSSLYHAGTGKSRTKVGKVPSSFRDLVPVGRLLNSSW